MVKQKWIPAFAGMTMIYWLLFSSVIAAQITPSVETYEQLIAAIKEVRYQTELHFQQQKIDEAWAIGSLINTYVEKSHMDPSQRKKVVYRIADDLDVGPRMIYYMSALASAYKKPPIAGKLNWNHYRELAYIEDEQVREEVTQEAERLGWGRERIREEVQRLLKGLPKKEETDLKLEDFQKPGKLYTYRIEKAKQGPFQGQLVLDLGFSTMIQPSEVIEMREGDYVEISQDQNLKRIEAGPEDLYTYKIYPIKIIDGDTFTALVDLGFHITLVHKFRLEDVDAPELNAEKGAAARDFLEKQLFSAQRVKVRTRRSDQYGRYLADVFVDGHFLSNELISQGLAEAIDY